MTACTAWALLVVPTSGAAGAEPKEDAPRLDRASIQMIVDEFRTRLSIPQEVVVSIVPENARLVSVEWMKGRDGAFLLSMEEAFLGVLSEAELEAVVAHELGHVWIFTHHPYLHTERLANQIAMRLVSRDSLASMYTKMWARSGAKGDLSRFLGE